MPRPTLLQTHSPLQQIQMLTLSDKPEVQAWNSPKFSCPSGPAVMTAGITVAAGDNENRFMNNIDEYIPSTTHYYNSSINAVHQWECIPSNMPSNEGVARAGIAMAVSQHDGHVISTSFGEWGTGHRYHAEFEIEQHNGSFHSSEGYSTVDSSSPICNPSEFSPEGGISSPQPDGQQPLNPFGHSDHHSTASTFAQDHGFGNQQYSVPLEAHDAGADADISGGCEDMTGYSTESSRHEPPAEPCCGRCKYCGGSFKALARHIRDVHRKIRTIDCPEDGCKRKGNKGFGRQDNLRDHRRRVHDIQIPKSRRRKTTEAK
ncbi:hypothetical protein K440DRAFT_657405 [Wilcoxina mikolae CBS 423.85]|nr:hypothetical protein K440DRAFT_657405 [Wilcoxina mikolae CBS 423.85]